MPDLPLFLRDFIIGPAHVGFVVADLEVAVAKAAALYGFPLSEVEYQPPRDVDAATRFAFFEVGGLQFEYIEPCSEVFKQQLFAVASGGGGINHVAWRVRDIERAVDCLAEKGVRPGYVTPDGVISIGQKKMIYLDPETTGGLLVELLEYEDPGSG